jgi:hypothetical protein
MARTKLWTRRILVTTCLGTLLSSVMGACASGGESDAGGGSVAIDGSAAADGSSGSGGGGASGGGTGATGGGGAVGGTAGQGGIAGSAGVAGGGGTGCAVDPDGTPCTVPGLLGPCAEGECTSGQCQQTTFPTAEDCNGIDNDCDGTADNGTWGACTVPGVLGPCAAGQYQCTNGALTCDQTVFPQAEQCNGTDDDCDGTVDNGFPEQGQSCFTGQPGVCSAGTWQCQSGTLYCKRNIDPPQDVCSENDNCLIGQPCDGGCGTYQCSKVTLKAECVQGATGACSVSGLQGLCGQWQCVSGSLQCQQTVFSSSCGTQYPSAGFVKTLGGWGCLTGDCSSGSGSCKAGDCTILECQPGHADIDKAISNGCECQTDFWGKSCGARSVFSVPKGTTATNNPVLWTGKIETAIQSKWAQFDFQGAPPPGGLWNPKVQLTNSASGQYAIQIFQQNSCTTFASCQTGSGNNLDVWEQNYNQYNKSGSPTGCCSDATPKVTSLIVRVFRKNLDTPTCQSFTVTVTNP